ncbi:MAG: hypothetical protein ACKPKO_00425 [Candidatus Fonsibacter sp.]
MYDQNGGGEDEGGVDVSDCVGNYDVHDESNDDIRVKLICNGYYQSCNGVHYEDINDAYRVVAAIVDMAIISEMLVWMAVPTPS